MDSQANIKAVVTARDEASVVLSKFGDNLNAVGDKASSAERSFSQFTKAFVFGNVIFSLGTDLAIKLKEGFQTVATSAKEWQNQQAQLNAALLSTHDVSGVSAEDAKRYAEELSKTTPISREVALAGENMLLTFTNIHKDVFPQTTQAIADMATRMNHGLTPSAEQLSNTAIMVGKAMNDPAVGLSRLMRVGVEFTTQQKDQIKTLQQHGDMMGAQKIILDELSKEFGGSATAAAKTWSGELQRVKNSLVDMGVNGVQKLSDHVNAILPGIITHMGNLYTKVHDFLKPSFDSLWDTITTKLMPALGNFWHQIIEPLIPVLGVLLVGSLKLLVDWWNFLLAAITPVINFMADHKGVVEVLAGAFVTLKVSMMLGEAFDALKLGFATLQVVTIPSMMASLSALGTAFIAAVPVAAVLAELATVFAKGQETLNLLDRLNTATANDSSQAGAMKDVINAYHSGKISKAQYQSFFQNISGARAAGGPVIAGNAYLVGEKGPEIIVPNQSGTVIPNGKASSSTSIFNISINAGTFMGTDIEARKHAQTILKHLKDIANSKNTSLVQMIGA